MLTFKEIKHLSDYRTVGPSDCRTIGLSDYRSDPGVPLKHCFYLQILDIFYSIYSTYICNYFAIVTSMIAGTLIEIRLPKTFSFLYLQAGGTEQKMSSGDTEQKISVALIISTKLDRWVYQH